MGSTYFEIEVRNVELVPVSAKFCKYTQNKTKLLVHFDVDGYKQIITESTAWPYSWQDCVQKVLYYTFWADQFHDKVMKIMCKKPSLFAFDDKTIGVCHLDFHTLASGPCTFELPMIHPIYQTAMCLIKFECRMSQILYRTSIRLQNINMTKALFATNQKATDLQISLGYIDPIHSQWQPQHFPLTKEAFDVEKAKLMIKNLTIEIPEKTRVEDFIQGSLHLVVWNKTKSTTLGVDVMQEYGRMIIPLLGAYDVSKSRVLYHHGKILWNQKLQVSSSSSSETAVPCVLNVIDGPVYVQMPEGMLRGKQISGTYWPGFPTPSNPNLDFAHFGHANTTEFISEFVINERILSKLVEKGYQDFPHWFTHPKPNITEISEDCNKSSSSNIDQDSKVSLRGSVIKQVFIGTNEHQKGNNNNNKYKLTELINSMIAARTKYHIQKDTLYSNYCQSLAKRNTTQTKRLQLQESSLEKLDQGIQLKYQMNRLLLDNEYKKQVAQFQFQTKLLLENKSISFVPC